MSYIEAKLFGIGAKTYTPGSGEFCLKYASENKKKGVVVLMDTGHYHPTEVVSEKVSAILALLNVVSKYEKDVPEKQG